MRVLRLDHPRYAIAEVNKRRKTKPPKIFVLSFMCLILLTLSMVACATLSLFLS
jgi:hypothetical protein